MSQCQFSPLCPMNAQANGYCIGHRRFASGEPRKKEKVTVVREVKKITEKRAEEEKQYKKIVRELFKDSDECEIKSPVCIKTATGLHHKKRRGANLLNKKYLLRACDPCNEYLESHPQYALDNGFSISKFKKEVE